MVQDVILENSLCTNTHTQAERRGLPGPDQVSQYLRVPPSGRGQPLLVDLVASIKNPSSSSAVSHPSPSISPHASYPQSPRSDPPRLPTQPTGTTYSLANKDNHPYCKHHQLPHNQKAGHSCLECPWATITNTASLYQTPAFPALPSITTQPLSPAAAVSTTTAATTPEASTTAFNSSINSKTSTTNCSEGWRAQSE